MWMDVVFLNMRKQYSYAISQWEVDLAFAHCGAECKVIPCIVVTKHKVTHGDVWSVIPIDSENDTVFDFLLSFLVGSGWNKIK
jgi:hypothetical protein